MSLIKNKTFILTFLLAVMFSKISFAGCAPPQDLSPQEIEILQTYKARHGLSPLKNGCLVKISSHQFKETIVYSPFNYICQTELKKKITASFDYACCDTGDQGEFTCGVKPLNPLNQFSRTFISIGPIDFEVQALSQLFEQVLRDPQAEAQSYFLLKKWYPKAKTISNGQKIYQDQLKKIVEKFKSSENSYQKVVLGRLAYIIDPQSIDLTELRIAEVQVLSFFEPIDVVANLKYLASQKNPIAHLTDLWINAARSTYDFELKKEIIDAYKMTYPLGLKKISQMMAIINNSEKKSELFDLLNKGLCQHLKSENKVEWLQFQGSEYSDIPTVKCP